MYAQTPRRNLSPAACQPDNVAHAVDGVARYRVTRFDGLTRIEAHDGSWTGYYRFTGVSFAILGTVHGTAPERIVISFETRERILRQLGRV